MIPDRLDIGKAERIVPKTERVENFFKVLDKEKEIKLNPLAEKLKTTPLLFKKIVEHIKDIQTKKKILFVNNTITTLEHHNKKKEEENARKQKKL